jgi:hypothetical protein
VRRDASTFKNNACIETRSNALLLFIFVKKLEKEEFTAQLSAQTKTQKKTQEWQKTPTNGDTLLLLLLRLLLLLLRPRRQQNQSRLFTYPSLKHSRIRATAVETALTNSNLRSLLQLRTIVKTTKRNSPKRIVTSAE